MAAMMGAKGASMMEDGLNKLAKVTSKFDNLGPGLSDAAPKTSLTDSLFGLPPSDDKMPALGNNRNMSKSKGWILQSSLLTLWMDENSSQQSNKNCWPRKTYNNTLIQQPNWPELLLHGEYKQGCSTDEVCWKY